MIRVCALAFCVLSVSAYADDPPKRDWQILNFEDGKCHEASAAMPRTPNPEMFHRMLRAEGVIDTVHVHKGLDGEVEDVRITANTRQGEVEWFWSPTKDLCELALTILKTQGAISDDNDQK